MLLVNKRPRDNPNRGRQSITCEDTQIDNKHAWRTRGLKRRGHFEEFLRHSISYKFAAARKRKTVENTFVKWVDRKPFPKIGLAKVVPDDHE